MGVTENCLISSKMELFGFTWVLRKNFVYINIGTGLSYAHFKDKQIYSGAKGYAIHFASSKISLYDWKNNKKLSKRLSFYKI